MKKPPGIAQLVEVLLTPPLEYATAVEVRDRFREMVERTRQAHVLVTHHGKPQAALIDYEAFQALQQLVLRLSLFELEQGQPAAPARRFEPADDPTVAEDAVAAGRRARKRVQQRNRPDAAQTG